MIEHQTRNVKITRFGCLTLLKGVIFRETRKLWWAVPTRRFLAGPEVRPTGIVLFRAMCNRFTASGSSMKRSSVLIYKICCIGLVVVLATCLGGPLEAQLGEAGRVAWPGFQVLQGRWLALDGKNVIDIGKIDLTGGMQVKYFNPDPVHVARAQAARDGQAVKVWLELRDPHSPCCTYDLTYNPGNDQLQGVYWQKGDRKSTEVVFIREK